MHRSHDIGFIRIYRIPVGIPDNGLSSQMKHQLRLSLLKGLSDLFQIPYVSDDRFHPSLKTRHGKQGRIGGRLKGKARDLSPRIH